MRKFISSMILSMFISFFSVLVVFFIQAPLLSLVYYGFFSENSTIVNSNIINKVVSKDTVNIFIMIFQIILTLGFSFIMFEFINRIINIFLKDENLIRPYYSTFFFFITLIPNIIIYFSIFIKVKLAIFTLVISVFFYLMLIMIIIASKKILPDTTNIEYRKNLFTKGQPNE